MRVQELYGRSILYAIILIDGFTASLSRFLLNNQKICFSLGVDLPMFTVTPEFFTMYRYVSYWRFEVTYTNSKKSAFGAVQLRKNHPPPARQTCLARPISGFTNQLFTITCTNSTDVDGIKDYFLHGKKQSK